MNVVYAPFLRILAVVVLPMVFFIFVNLQSAAGGDTGEVFPSPGELIKEPVTGYEFVRIPGGCFPMGSPESDDERFENEEPLREVCVKAFWMGRYEVTNAQFRMFRPDHDGGGYMGRSLNGDNQPAVKISWNDTQTFINWLSAAKGGGWAFRLPTEAQWEYACRAGASETRFWGDDPDNACRYANVADRSAGKYFPGWKVHDCDDGFAVTAPVKRTNAMANPFGLFDILGNVQEWTEDVYGWYTSADRPLKDPVNTRPGRYRVYRGGGWNVGPRHARCVTRGYYSLHSGISTSDFAWLQRLLERNDFRYQIPRDIMRIPSLPLIWVNRGYTKNQE